MAEESSTSRVADPAKPSASANGAPKVTASPKIKRKGATKGTKKANKARRPGRKPYPVIPFEQALRFGQSVGEIGAGHPVKRATLLEKMGLSVNQSTKDLITASNKYNITNGSHGAEEFSLTQDGSKAVEQADSPDQRRARIKLAVLDIEPFKKLYEKFRGGKMPAIEAMRDTLDELNEGDRAPCVDIFVQNAKFVGILQTREGAEFFVNTEDASPAILSASNVSGSSTAANKPVTGEDFDTVCFFISPIGADNSEHRQHSDAILSSYVEKALATVDPKLRVVRADKITQPGMITKQVI